ncbi:MAG: DNA polymerase I [Desulfobacterota bacterium]|nr:DNA polymerase I [Thermodesulfobacteriota bacterium]MDW8001468.1 DNA polymerase I [Deltaproteobacteria bacterium]
MSFKDLRKLFLVDGNSFLYRAYYATPFLATSRGVPTNATYAMTNMILKLLKEQKPDLLFVVFDSKVPSFRHKISKEYKAQRRPMPDNLSVQIPYVKSIIEALGIKMIEVEGYEADDIIGTIVERLKDKDFEIYIVTGDKDLMQFVQKNVFVYDTMKEIIYGEKEVREKFGVPPSSICDLLALSGDTSDNIPGVPGIGEKTAKLLIQEFGNLENLYERIDEVKKDSLRKKLEEGKDLAFLSKRLLEIRSDVPIPDLSLNYTVTPDKKRLKALFRELEFTSLYREIELEEKEPELIDEVELDILQGESFGLFVKFERGPSSPFPEFKAFAVYDGKNVSYSEKKDDVLKIVGKAKEVILYNMKDFLLSEIDIDSKKAFDIAISAYLIDPLKRDLSIETILEEHLDLNIPSKVEKHKFFQLAKGLFDVKDLLARKMAELNLEFLFYHVEMPLVEVLSEMEKTGVKVDREKLLKFSSEMDFKLKEIAQRIYELAGEEFNINSHKQLSNVLFGKLNLRPLKKTKKGYSTDMDVLEELIDVHPIIPNLLEYRTLSKLKNTYIDVLPLWIHPKTQRIHASFNQTNVATGRISTSNPNLQNIPIRGEEGKKIREAFIAEEGFFIMSADYSQIELRVLAHLSHDETLIRAFKNGEDIHTNVAREFFKVKEEEVTPEMRRIAKTVNFGIIYGISAYGLSKELGILQSEAQRYIDDFFRMHRQVKEYMDMVIKEAERTGYVRTYYGRIRYIPELYNPDQKIKQLGVRLAMNTPIQGTAADLIKMAMVNIHSRKKELGLGSRLILQIHDELLFEVKEDEKEIMERLVREEMENVATLDVPLKVSIGFGKNWAEAKT